MTGAEQRARLSVLVLIDALGWQFLKSQEFLNDLLPHRQPLRTVLGYSSGAIPTILTGVSPAEHGHWNLFYYDPEGSPFRWLRHLQFLPQPILNHRVTRKALKEFGRRGLGLGQMFECCVSPNLLPYFNWIEKRDLYTCGAISGARSIFDELADGGIPYRVYSDHSSPDKKVLERARQDLRAGTAQFYFLYLREMDDFLHEHCNERPQLAEKLAWYAAELRTVFNAALKLDPQASLSIVSDHGMTPVREHYDLIQQVNSLGFTMPRDYLAVYDSTMARFWFFNERARREVIDLLKRLPCGSLLPDEELKRMGVFFPDRRYGEVMMLLHPGWLLSRSDFNGPRWMPVGMHGYHPDDPYSDAIFLSNREPIAPVRTIADLYPCMRAAAGLRTAPLARFEDDSSKSLIKETRKLPLLGLEVPPSDAPLISVIILNYKRLDALAQALDSVLSQEYPNREIIVVDNHSEEDVRGRLESRGARVQLVELAQNLGACAGRNAGIRRARGQIVVTLDNDVCFASPFELSRIVRAFEEFPDVHVLAFQVCDRETGELRVREWCHPKSWKQFGQSEFETYFFGEGASAYRRRVFEESGLYYEPFFICGEGFDLALRFLDHGFRILHCPRIRVQHQMLPETRTPDRFYYFSARNWIWIARKDFHLADGIRWLVPKMAALVYLTCRARCFNAFLRGLWDGIRGLKTVRLNRTPIRKATVLYLSDLEKGRPGLMFRLKRHRSQVQV